MKKTIALIISCTIALSPSMADAGILWHATKKSAAKKIYAQGFNQKKMSPDARFGKGVYLSESKNTALKEKPRADAVLKFKESKNLKNNNINLAHPTNNKLKALSGDNDLRGNIRKGIIGPDLGKKIGRKAAQNDKSIIYKSAKNPKGTNYYIPSEVYKRHPNIIRKQGVEYGK